MRGVRDIIVPATPGVGGGGLTNIVVAANGTTNSLSNLVFANSNNITFGLSDSTITANFHVAVSGSNGSFTFKTLTLGSSNGMHFYTTNGSIVGSYTVPTQTNQTLEIFGLGNTTGESTRSTYDARTLSLRGAGIVSVGWSNSSLYVSATVPAQTNQTLGGYFLGNTTGESSSSTWDARTLSIRGDGIISVGWSNSSMRISATVPAQSVQTLGIYASSLTVGESSSSTYDARSLTIIGKGVASVGWSNSSLIVSVPAGGGAGDGGVFLAAGTRTAITNDTVLFDNANGVTFGLNAVDGSVMTASIATSLTNIKVSAGTTSNNLSAITFSDSNGINFGLNGSVITASLTSYTMGTFMNAAPANVLTVGAVGQNSVWLMPFRIPGYLSASSGQLIVALTGSVTSNQTNTVGATLKVGLYKATGTQFTSFDSTFSTSLTFRFWNSGTASVSYAYDVTSGSSAGSNLMTASVYGHRVISFNIGSTLDPGLYAWAFVLSTSSAGNSSVMRSFNVHMNSPGLFAAGFIGSSTNGSLGWAEAGFYSTTTNNLPAGIAINEITAASNLVPLFKMGAY